MLIICCGMVRSGSTLQYQLAKAVVEPYGGIGLGFLEEDNLPDSAHRMAVIKCHLRPPNAPDLLKSGRARGIYIYRDVRDVMVSQMRKDNHPFSVDAIRTWLRLDTQWRSLPNMLVSRYEDLNLENEVMAIARHLRLPLSWKMAQVIANRHTLAHQQKRIAQIETGYDPKTLLHWNHITSGGKSGLWREALTPSQIEAANMAAGWWLRDNGYMEA